MTRKEYEAKYGTAPSVSTSTPVRMTRQEYQAKYGQAPSVSQETVSRETASQGDGILKTMIKDPIKTLVVKPATRFGQAVGSGIIEAFGTDEMKRRADIARSQDTNVDLGPLGSYNIEAAKNQRQVAGEALYTAAYLFPYGKVAGVASKGVSAIAPKAARTVGNIAAGAAGGYTADVGINLQEGKTGAEAFKPGVGTVIGGAIPAVGAFAGKVIRKAAQHTPDSRMREMTRNYRSLQNVYEEGTRYTKDPKTGARIIKSEPIKTITERKLTPKVVDGKVDTSEMIAQLSDELEGLAKPRAEMIKTSRRSIPFSKFEKDVRAAIRSSRELRSSGQVTSTLNKANAIMKDLRKSFGSRVTLNTLDDVRTTMNRRYDPDLRDAFRAIGDAARKHVYALDETSRPILMQEGEILSAIRFLETLNGKAVKGGRLGNYVSNILGAMVGGSTQIPIAGPLIGALGGNALNRAIRNAYFRAPMGVGRGAQMLESGIQDAGRVIEQSGLQFPGDAAIDAIKRRRTIFGRPR